MKNKKVHLARFVALYLAGCIFTGGAVCYAANKYGNGNDEVIISDGETYTNVLGSQYNSTSGSTSINIISAAVRFKTLYTAVERVALSKTLPLTSAAAQLPVI